MLVLYIILVAIAFLSFCSRKYIVFLICYLGLMTKLFLLDTSEVITFRGEDICVFLNFALLPIAIFRNNKILDWNNGRIWKWVYVYIAFILLEFVLTVITGADSFLYSLKVVRVPLMMVGYFLFVSIPLKDYEKFLRILFAITIIQTFLFFLQYLGINLLADALTNESNSDILGIDVKMNIPTFAFFFIFYALKARSLQERSKILLFTVMMLIVFLTYARGWILSIILGLAYYIVKLGNKKRKLILLFSLILLIPISTIFIGKKTSEQGGVSTSGDLIGVFSNINNLSNVDEGNGTFSFRIAMLTERVLYLAENPRYLLTGVGTMHEDSPSTLSRFRFYIGTRNDERYYGRCLIESGDITWVPIVLRYGLIGVFIHAMLFVIMIGEAKKRKDVLFVLAPLYFSLVFFSFDGAFFEMPVFFYQLILFLALMSRAIYENKELSI
ncbi:hypothetical protein SAMN02745192_0655 [Xylanibacter ruminicola]|uniref:Membrane protein n=3 Tax=Xylanibacter ruminicola TaxID=839 RepID=D5ET83_XYLR2|nr:putative membrane protein [Xylanibacter ruminicola 23]SEH65457.1 hypothetical protein SAMN02745192_0655 [Xylanibacter ruminicola]